MGKPLKRLHGVSRSQYRLRVNEVRVFYDVSEQTVEILSIVLKSEAEEQFLFDECRNACGVV